MDTLDVGRSSSSSSCIGVAGTCPTAPPGSTGCTPGSRAHVGRPRRPAGPPGRGHARAGQHRGAGPGQRPAPRRRGVGVAQAHDGAPSSTTCSTARLRRARGGRERPHRGPAGRARRADVVAACAARRGRAPESLLHGSRRAGVRVQLARRFHNDAVTDVRRVRRKWVVRLFRLAGHADLPAHRRVRRRAARPPSATDPADRRSRSRPTVQRDRWRSGTRPTMGSKRVPCAAP